MSDNCFPSIPEPLDEIASKHWLRFEEAVTQSEDFSDQQSKALLKQATQRKDLSGVWACSDFIAQSCISQPVLLRDLLDEAALDQSNSRSRIVSAMKQTLDGCESEDQLHYRLRKIRQRLMVQLAWRDLAGQAGVEETMECVSALAEQSIDYALRYHDRWLSEKYGEPWDQALGQRAEMMVLGLGKLGGAELNYSSDVDLIFAYSGAGTTRGNDDQTPRCLDNQAYFTRLGRRIIAALDPVTADGFVFRTDMRLRPNGESGPLVLSIAAMEHYYQTHGRTWERYALIKARVVAGDIDQGGELINMLRPFVYRKYLDFGAFDSIREMKGMIKRELRQSGSDRNIKLGWGGIREIEFLVQSYQLIRGGRDKSLQTCSLYTAVNALTELHIISDKVADQLLAAYRFLRNVEHRLQMVSDRQTQLLPEQEFEKLRLAWSMGFSEWQCFYDALSTHRHYVHDQFRSILEGPGNESQEQHTHSKTSPYSLDDIWQGKYASEQAIIGLTELGFGVVESTPQLLTGFREGRLYQSFSGVERDRIDRLIPLALVEAAKHAQSERAMTAFISILEAIGRRTVYLSLLIENPIALRQLLHLSAVSSWVSQHIGQHPVILDELLHPLVDIRDHSMVDVENELDHRLAQIDEDDEEGRLNGLREFHHAQTLRIAAADVSGVLTVEEVHRGLTVLAEVLLQRVFDDSVVYVNRKLPNKGYEAGVIAYGKFASGELGYHSDLDVVICFQQADDNLSDSKQEAEHFFSRVAQRFIHLLSTRTHAGRLYRIDMRLRPSGRSGTLVTSLTGFFNYQHNNAWIWEHQALVRARPVVGDDGFCESFEQNRKSVICLSRQADRLKAGILNMRRRMIDANCQSTAEVYDIKLDEGGIVDIEFLIQYWVLLYAHEYSTLAKPRTTKSTITTLVSAQLISPETGTILQDCYRTYLRQSLDLKLMDSPVLIGQNELLEERNKIKQIWQQTFD